MSVANVSSATGASNPLVALRTALQKAPGTSSSVSATSVQSAAQENMETPSQTRAEAAQGNLQAEQKLAQERAALLDTKA
jgi:hypothetical protein